MHEPTLADILEFESWPPEQRHVAEVYFGMLVEGKLEYKDGMEIGFQLGYEQGLKAGKLRAELNGEIN